MNSVEWIRRDLRYAVRSLLRDRGSVALAVLALSLGIGARTVIFSVFVLLPGASLVVLSGLLVEIARRGRVSWSASAAGFVALLYLVTLAFWPVAWFA